MAQREADPSLKPPSPGHLCEECKQQLAWAERELGAFQKACEEIFGEGAAIQAAESWVTLAETVAPSGLGDVRHWRQISIMAACQMATSHGLRPSSELHWELRER